MVASDTRSRPLIEVHMVVTEANDHKMTQNNYR